MTNGRKIALAAVAVAVIALGCFIPLAVRVANFRMVCDREVIDHKISPDGRLKAEIIDIDCGATTGFATRVVIADATKPFDDARDEAAYFRGMARRLEWDGTSLRVFYGDAEPTKTPDHFRGTSLSYLKAE